MRDELRQSVCDASRALAAGGLTFRAWGSVSAVDRESHLVAITPAGGAAEASGPASPAVVALDGTPVDGPVANPDAPTHLAIYRRMKDVAALAFSYGPYATAWAQARRPIPAFGAIHAEMIGGELPCTAPLPDDHPATACDDGIALAVADAAGELSAGKVPGVLVANLCLVTFGRSPAEAVERAEIIEHVARLARLTTDVEPYPRGVSPTMLRWLRLRGQGSGETKP